MIIMLLRRSERLSINVIFLFYFLCGGEWCEEGVEWWRDATKDIKNSQINPMVFVFLDG